MLPRSPSGRAGMTLIELIVALAIIGVLLGVTTMAISAVADRFSSPGERLGEIVSGARTTAARRAEPLRLRLLAGGRYELVAIDSPVVVEEGSLPVAEVAPVPTAVTFYPAGTSSGGSFCIRDESAWERFEVDRVTGALIPAPCTGCCPVR
ncbi:MAG TPA: prepilin-type N-terminal cleavage/methylation domain-containing protein [Longimicrobiaceae bacterium]|nr:prepilin-type N-terminal cleavage/methylation domain-containing protein [Longimicrobiaceae bacterium]